MARHTKITPAQAVPDNLQILINDTVKLIALEGQLVHLLREKDKLRDNYFYKRANNLEAKITTSHAAATQLKELIYLNYKQLYGEPVI